MPASAGAGACHWGVEIGNLAAYIFALIMSVRWRTAAKLSTQYDVRLRI